MICRIEKIPSHFFLWRIFVASSDQIFVIVREPTYPLQLVESSVLTIFSKVVHNCRIEEILSNFKTYLCCRPSTNQPSNQPTATRGAEYIHFNRHILFEYVSKVNSNLELYFRLTTTSAWSQKCPVLKRTDASNNVSCPIPTNLRYYQQPSEW